MSRATGHENKKTRSKPNRFSFRGCWTLIAIVILFSRAPFAQSTLPHLRGIGEIRDWFNAGKGHVRVILLLSPT
jgi:hypothetical protein